MEKASREIEYLIKSLPAVHVWLPDGSETVVECTLQTVCAIAIVRGITHLHELRQLVQTPFLTYNEWERVSEIVSMSLSRPMNTITAQIDAIRIMKDNKYSVLVQESLSSMSYEEVSGLIHSSFRGHFLALSLDSFGCRVIQKLIEVSSPADCLALVHLELSHKIVDCAMDVNGNHVVQKLIDVLPSSECQFMVDAILLDNHLTLRRLCTHCFGCRVIQRIMSRCASSQTDTLFEAICSDPSLIVGLSSDAFGNYVIQHALEYGRSIDRDRIIVCLASLDIVALSCCKFASNVVEKAIRNHNKLSLTTPSSILVTRLLIGSLLNGAEEPAILTLMKDRYGNYVVRAIVELTNPEFNTEVSRVTTMILGNATSLKKFTFSWHLVEKLGKRNHGL